MTINVQDIDPDEFDPTYEHAGFEIDDEDEYPYTWYEGAEDEWFNADYYGFDDDGTDCD